MNYVSKIFLLVIISMAVTSYPKAASLSGDQMDADTIINNYFIALTQGDTNTIKSLLGGDQLEKRKRLLDNPTYPEHLLNIYHNAQLEITNNMIGNNSITIDVVITLNSGETMNLQYVLKKDLAQGMAGQYHIYSESTPEALNF